MRTHRCLGAVWSIPGASTTGTKHSRTQTSDVTSLSSAPCRVSRACRLIIPFSFQVTVVSAATQRLAPFSLTRTSSLEILSLSKKRDTQAETSRQRSGTRENLERTRHHDLRPGVLSRLPRFLRLSRSPTPTQRGAVWDYQTGITVSTILEYDTNHPISHSPPQHQSASTDSL